MKNASPLAINVQRVLMSDWDPCGINDINECADEYDRYVPRICELLALGAPVSDIANYLHFVAHVQMGLTRIDKEHATKAALVLAGLRG